MKEKREYGPYFDVTDYIGKRTGKLVVVGLGKKDRKGQNRLKCLCDCGRETNITPSQFRRNVVKSCGCSRQRADRAGKGRSKHPLYSIWNQMMKRCNNPESPNYHRYGGRGIKVCKEWHNFWNFAKWAEPLYEPGLTLDRSDNDGDYSPENCRWITQHDQNRNKSDNVKIEFKGKCQTLSEWAEELGMTFMCINHRYNRGWPVERILTEPVHMKGRKND